MPFPNLMGPVWLEEELVKYNLGLFARFVAYIQVVTGILLLTQRFATLGALMLFPMLLNILVITISLQWRGTPYVVSFFLLLNIFLFLYDYPRLKALISEDKVALQLLPLKRKSATADVALAFGILCLTGGASLYHRAPVISWIMVSFGTACMLFASCYEVIFRK